MSTATCLKGGIKGSQSVLWALPAAWLMKSGGRDGSQSVHVSMCVRSLAWKGRHGSSPALNIPSITPHSPDNLVSIIAHFFTPSFYSPSAIHCTSLGILFFLSATGFLPVDAHIPSDSWMSLTPAISKSFIRMPHSGGANLTPLAELHGGPMIKLSPFHLTLNSSKSSLLN